MRVQEADYPWVGPVEASDVESAKAEIVRLVGEYRLAVSDGRASRISEEETKKDFILPLFKALGWSVDSNEVSAEERVLRGRADYGFKLDTVTRFFVEAKSLSTDLLDRTYLQQVIDYSYAKGVPWAILTNFARTIVLDADWKVADPARARVLDLSAEDYVPEFSKLTLLSKKAFLAKRLEAFAEQQGSRPKKWPIDKQLLKDLNSFRLDLAKDIRERNDGAFREDDEGLEETVQRLLDRLIFMRVAEDRDLEDRQLSLIANGPEHGAVSKLRELFQHYDRNFDSRLFQTHAVDSIRVDGGVLQRVLRGLRQTQDESVRYDFAAIDADVLGVMYEQYLGLILKQTAKRAKLSDGTANRKEQGIYYTPTWVVDYIVKLAIDQALERKGAVPDTLRILDPSCGSGTFLLRAFDHIMRVRNPSGGRVQSTFDPENAGRLLALRTSVLTENLFGIDLDARAVEIAQLNLMIRAAETRHRLPTLERNLQIGNSLVASPDVDAKAVDWDRVFRTTVGAEGFDVVIGNPPWVQSKFLPEGLKSYYASVYSNASRQYDLFTLFVERGVQLLRPGGILGFIVPDRFIANPDYGGFRRWLLDSVRIVRITPTGEGVFEGVDMPSTILIVRKPRRGRPSANEVVEIQEGVSGRIRTVTQGKLASGNDHVFSAVFADEESSRILEQVEHGSIPMSELFDNARGVEIGKSHPAISPESGDVPFLVGEDISRYQTRGAHWLELGHPDIPARDYKEPELYRGWKILIRKTGEGINATLDKDSYVIQVVYIFKPKEARTDLYHTLGILNSKLMAFYYHSKFGQKERGVFPHLTQNKVLQLPIVVPKGNRSTISGLVSQLLVAYGELSKLGGIHLDREAEIRARVSDLENRVDDAVFDLYGITEQDRAFVLSSLRGGKHTSTGEPGDQ